MSYLGFHDLPVGILIRIPHEVGDFLHFRRGLRISILVIVNEVDQLILGQLIQHALGCSQGLVNNEGVRFALTQQMLCDRVQGSDSHSSPRRDDVRHPGEKFFRVSSCLVCERFDFVLVFLDCRFRKNIQTERGSTHRGTATSSTFSFLSWTFRRKVASFLGDAWRGIERRLLHQVIQDSAFAPPRNIDAHGLALRDKIPGELRQLPVEKVLAATSLGLRRDDG